MIAETRDRDLIAGPHVGGEFDVRHQHTAHDALNYGVGHLGGGSEEVLVYAEAWSTQIRLGTGCHELHERISV